MDPFETRLKSLPLRAPSSSFGQPETLRAILDAAPRPKQLRLKSMVPMRWKSTAAAIIGLAICVVVAYFLLSTPNSGSIAFAQVAEKLRSAQCITFDTVITTTRQQEPKMRYRTSYMAPGKTRTDMGDTITIRDQLSGNMLTLNTKMKTAFVTTTKIRNGPAATELPDPIDLCVARREKCTAFR